MYLINYLGSFHTCLLNNSLINFSFFHFHKWNILEDSIISLHQKLIIIWKKKILKISNISCQSCQGSSRVLREAGS
jgi:hypothetical protein